MEQMQPTLDGFVTLADAAARANVSPNRLRDLAAAGQIAAQKVAGRWLIHESGLAAAAEQIAETSRKPGQGARIEAALERLERELEVAIGAIDHLDERLQEIGNLIVLRVHGVENAHAAGIGVPFDEKVETEAQPAQTVVQRIADEILLDQSSLAAQEQVERADRALRTTQIH